MTTPTTVNVRLQLRADTAANWTAANPTLLANEVGLETDTKKLKVGSGSTSWNSLAYFPSIVTGGTVLGNLEIGSTGTLTFEGSTADGFETTLAVTNPTADRTITLPNQSGTVVVSGNASIVDADIAANAEIAVSKLANGAANQVIVTDGTNVSWSDDLTLAGNLTVNGTTTTINTQDLLVEDKNIIIGNVDTPSDVTADGGGITLKGTTDKTINWIDATDAWTSSEHINIASGKEYRIAGTSVLTGTTLGSGITSSSLTSVGTLGSLTVTGSTTAGTFIPTSGTAPSNGLYLPAANSVALSTDSTERLRIDSSGRLLVGTSSSFGGGKIQVANANINIGAYVGALSGSYELIFNKSRSATVGTQTVVANGDTLGQINFQGSDGTLQVPAAYIFAQVDGTPGTNDMPGRLVFSTTADGASSPTERMRITSGGNVLIGTSTPTDTLTVNGGASISGGVYSETGTVSLTTGVATTIKTLGNFFNNNEMYLLSVMAVDGNNAWKLIAYITGGDLASSGTFDVDTVASQNISASFSGASLQLTNSGSGKNVRWRLLRTM